MSRSYSAMELASQRITEHLRDKNYEGAILRTQRVRGVLSNNISHFNTHFVTRSTRITTTLNNHSNILRTPTLEHQHSNTGTEELLQPQLRRLANIIESVEEKHKHRLTKMRETSMEISQDMKEREKRILEKSKARAEEIKETRDEAFATKNRLAAQMQGTLAAEIAVGKRAVSDAEEATKLLREKQRKGIKDDVFKQVRRLGEIADELRKHTHTMRSDAARRRIKEDTSSFLETNEETTRRRRRNRNLPCGQGGREDCPDEDSIETPEIVKSTSSMTTTTTTTSKTSLPNRHFTTTAGEMSTPLVTINNEACSHVQCLSTSSLSCTVPSGFGTKNKVVVELGDKKSKAQAILDYDAPEIDHIVPATAPTATSTQITILGKNFGCSNTKIPKIKVKIGEYVCSDPKRKCDNEIVCTLPSGTGGDLPVSLELTEDPPRSSMSSVTILPRFVVWIHLCSTRR